MQFKNIALEKRDGKGIITLNRPEHLNALSPELMLELGEALHDLGKDDNTHVIILQGNGTSFCAGIDLKLVDGFLGEASEKDLSRFGNNLLPVLKHIEQCEKPVICAVHGFAITGGFLLAYCCDLVIAADDAIFQDTHAKWGFVPGAWETLKLPRLVGIHRAKRIFLTCERISAREAEQMGLVYRVVPPENLEKETEELADRILKLSSESLKFIKEQINQCTKVDWPAAVEMDELIRKPLVAGFITRQGAGRLKGFGNK